jgi:hypothetical protein
MARIARPSQARMIEAEGAKKERLDRKGGLGRQAKTMLLSALG